MSLLSLSEAARLDVLERNYRTLANEKDVLQSRLDALTQDPDWQAYPVICYQGTTPITTIGNGLLFGRYLLKEGIVFFNIYMKWGSTTSLGGAGIIEFNLPFPPKALAYLQGKADIRDAGTAQRNYHIRNILSDYIGAVNELDGTLTSTVPWTWTTNDSIQISGSYEPRDFEKASV